MTKLDWSKFEAKFGGWARYIKPFFDEGGFDAIYDKLKQESLEGEKITPKSENTFKFLHDCPPEQLKVILIGQDPYPSTYIEGTLQATGVAFDCSNSTKGYLQPSLEAFFEGIEKDLGEKLLTTHDLTYLSKQGVLLGNRALTCRVDETGSHMGEWDEFWKFFLADIITAYFIDIPIVLMGKDAHKLKKYIFEIANPTFYLEHPSAAARGDRVWETEKTFSKINTFLKEVNNTEIKWEDLPF